MYVPATAGVVGTARKFEPETGDGDAAFTKSVATPEHELSAQYTALSN